MPKNLEIEAKVEIAPHLVPSIRARLGKLARFEGLEWERNELFDKSDWSLQKQGKLVRIREWRRGKRKGAVLTIKSRPFKRSFTRDEHNITIENASQMAYAIHDLGLHRIWVYEKRREEWARGKTLITLDFVPRLGWFCEIEAPSEAAVRAFAARLGLLPKQLLAKSYLEIAIERYGEHLPNLEFRKRT